MKYTTIHSSCYHRRNVVQDEINLRPLRFVLKAVFHLKNISMVWKTGQESTQCRRGKRFNSKHDGL